MKLQDDQFSNIQDSSSSDVQDNNADVPVEQPATNPFASESAVDPSTDSSSLGQVGSSVPTENQIPNESTTSGTAASPKVSQTSALDDWMPYWPFLIIPLLLVFGYILWRRFSNRGQHHDYESQRHRERTEERPEERLEQVAPDQVPRKTYRELNEPAAAADDVVVNLSDDSEPIAVAGGGLISSAIDADVVSIDDDEVSSLIDEPDLDIVVEAEEIADPQLANVGIADEESDDDIISFFDDDDGETESLTDDVELEQPEVLSSLTEASPDEIESAVDSLDADASLETLEDDDDEDLISLFGEDDGEVESLTAEAAVAHVYVI